MTINTQDIRLYPEEVPRRSDLDVLFDALFSWAKGNTADKLEFKQRFVVNDNTITITTDFFNIFLSDKQIEALKSEDLRTFADTDLERFVIVKGYLPVVDGTMSVKRISDGGTRVDIALDQRDIVERVRSKIPKPPLFDREFLTFAAIHFSFLFLIAVIMALVIKYH